MRLPPQSPAPEPPNEELPPVSVEPVQLASREGDGRHTRGDAIDAVDDQAVPQRVHDRQHEAIQHDCHGDPDVEKEPVVAGDRALS